MAARQPRATEKRSTPVAAPSTAHSTTKRKPVKKKKALEKLRRTPIPRMLHTTDPVTHTTFWRTGILKARPRDLEIESDLTEHRSSDEIARRARNGGRGRTDEEAHLFPSGSEIVAFGDRAGFGESRRRARFRRH